MLDWQLNFYDVVDSTNVLVKAAVEAGEPEGTCFIAREQTGAYGRQGRSWTSPVGGLYFSFILDPLTYPRKTLADLPALSLLVALAVQQALSHYADRQDIRIKWPNDVVVKTDRAFEKLCGISLEVVNQKVCIGVGVNVFSSTDQVPEGAYRFAYLENLAPLSRENEPQILDELLNTILETIDRHYTDWGERGIAPIIPAYNELLFNLGEQATLETITGKTIVSGTVVGASESGELLLQQPNGEILAANSGELHTHY